MRVNNVCLKKKQNCSGCELCVEVCPIKIIQMRPDEEGFYYPSIENFDKCINCGRCLAICPLENTHIGPREVLMYYAGYCNDEEQIKKSASGGLATIISKEFISKGGVVYGVQYSIDFLEIEYTRIIDEKELYRLSSSKYAQARKKNIYSDIAGDLKAGKMVLFVGLPCDVAAVNNLNSSKYSSLYTIELICHGPTSPKIHKEYCSTLTCNNCNNKLLDFSVRYKYSAWKPYYIYAKLNNSNSFYEVFHDSSYGVAFRYLKRPSCNICEFKLGNKRKGLQADLTLGDYHYAHIGMKEYNHWGSSVAFVHTNKGVKLLDSIKHDFNLFEIDSRTALMNEAIYRAIPSKFNRSSFSKRFSKKGIVSASNLISVKVIDRYFFLKNKFIKMAINVKNSMFFS